MRALKILLIIASLLITISIVYSVWMQLFGLGIFGEIRFYIYIYFAFIITISIVNIIYHFKSYHFYRRKEKRQLHKKVHKLLWVGTICFSVFLIYVSGSIFYNIFRFAEYGFGYTYGDMFIAIVYLVPGLLGFVEASYLKKRIVRLRKEKNVLEEIEAIGEEIE
jgi:Mn2+/Fe2+ NRAMP family transporter